MKKQVLASLAALFTSAGLALAQSPSSAPAPTGLVEKIGPLAKTVEPTPPPVSGAPVPSSLGDHNVEWGGLAPSSSDQGGSSFWASADYLLWWLRGAPLGVPIATTGSAADRRPGALGQPGTQIVSPRTLDYRSPFSGGRLSLGMWLCDDHTTGVEASGFDLQTLSARPGCRSAPTAPPAGRSRPSTAPSSGASRPMPCSMSPARTATV